MSILEFNRDPQIWVEIFFVAIKNSFPANAPISLEFQDIPKKIILKST